MSAPENTMPAFELAIEAGADGIELDVHLTADGHLVVRHDAVVDLPDGTSAPVRDLALEQLAAVDVGDQSSGPLRVPTLTDVFSLLAPTGLTLNVDIKNGPVPRPGIEDAVIAAHRGSGMSPRIVYSSFNHLTLVALSRREPGISIAPLYEEALVAPWDYVRRMGAKAAHPHYLTLALPGMIEGFRKAGIAVRAWTVNDPTQWGGLTGAGIDAIITDNPAAAVAVRDRVALVPAESGRRQQ